MLIFDRPRQYDDLACAVRRQCNPSSLSRSRRPMFEFRDEADRLRHATVHACDSSARFDPNARATRVPGRLPATLSSARASANNTGRFASETHRGFRHARHDGTRPRRTRSTPATLRSPRAGGVAPRHSQSGAQQACSGRGMRLPTSAVSAGIRAWRAARSRP